MTNILTDFSPHTLANAVEDNMAEQFAYFSRSALAEVDDSPERLRYLSGIPIPEYNGVLRARFSPDLAVDALDECIRSDVAYFTAHHQPFFWWVGPTTAPANLGVRLSAASFSHLGEGPGMAADLHELDERLPRPPGLTVVAVTDEHTLRDWTELAGAGYGEPAPVRQARYDVHLTLGFSSNLPLQRYVAYLEGQAVAMSALFLGAGVAGIHEVATAQSTRRKGIGAAVTLAPLQRARELGYHIGVLQASEMGTPLYTRLGFRQVCTFSLYAWEPPA